MGVDQRRDSPVWWLDLETTKQHERTDIRIGKTTTQRRDSRRLADDHYHQRMTDIAARRYDLTRPEAHTRTLRQQMPGTGRTSRRRIAAPNANRNG